jgi:hypothetical protein
LAIISLSNTIAQFIRFFASEQYADIDWPSRSPDMNPIENIWGIVAKEIND